MANFDTEFEDDALPDLVELCGYSVIVIPPRNNSRKRATVSALIEWNDTTRETATGRSEKSSGRVGIPASLTVTTSHTLQVEGEGLYVVSAVMPTQCGQTPCVITKVRHGMQTGSREVV